VCLKSGEHSHAGSTARGLLAMRAFTGTGCWCDREVQLLARARGGGAGRGAGGVYEAHERDTLLLKKQ
jgi:hypothetical protein